MIETPVFVPSGDDTLFGVLIRPDAESRNLIIVVGPGGPNAASFQRNGLGTRFSRRLAQGGLAVLRFDYHGIGDSTGEIQEFDLEKPLKADVAATLSWARRAGFDLIALVGICFGTRTALSAIDGDQDISAFALVTMPFADVIAVISQRIGVGGVFRRLFRPAAWARLSDPSHRRTYRKILKSVLRRLIGRRPDRSSKRRPTAFSRLEAATSRNIPVLMLYGAEDRHYLNARQSLEALQNAMPSLDVDAAFPGELHGFPTLEGQEFFVERVASWLTDRIATSGIQHEFDNAKGRN
jgi:dienelactone hydrolase